MLVYYFPDKSAPQSSVQSNPSFAERLTENTSDDRFVRREPDLQGTATEIPADKAKTLKKNLNTLSEKIRKLFRHIPSKDAMELNELLATIQSTLPTPVQPPLSQHPVDTNGGNPSTAGSSSTEKKQTKRPLTEQCLLPLPPKKRWKPQSRRRTHTEQIQSEARQIRIFPEAYRAFLKKLGDDFGFERDEHGKRTKIHKELTKLLQDQEVQQTLLQLPIKEDRLHFIKMELLKRWPLPLEGLELLTTTVVEQHPMGDRQ